MISIRQQKRWSCMQTCIAAILEVPLDEIPCATLVESRDDDLWYKQYWPRVHAYLASKNLFVMEFVSKEGWRPPGYSIGTIKVTYPDGFLSHAVVCLDGKIIMDPSEKQEFINDSDHLITNWSVFCILDPSKPIMGMKGKDDGRPRKRQQIG